MKKLIALFVTVLIAYALPAQVQVSLQLPPLGLTVKSQLWNLSLINTSGKDLTVQLQLAMTDVVNRQRVFLASSRPFLLPNGIQQLKAAALAPIAYTELNPAYRVDASPSGFLPTGLYSFCYTVILEGEASEAIAEECQDAEIEPLMPPMLLSPLDNEQIELDRPVFSWSPPAPVSLFNNLQYELRVAEVFSTQTALTAIQRNVPVLLRSNISSASFSYPLSMPALDTAKLYAWQVTARNGYSPVGVTEAWLFRLKKPVADTTVVTAPMVYYVRLDKDNSQPATICKGILYYAYFNELNSASVQLRVFDVTGSTHREVQLDSASVTVHPGENLMRLDLSAVAGMQEKHFYQLELVNALNERWYAKFEYHP